MDNRERAAQWNLEQILVYVWQMIGEDQSPDEYPYQAFATSNGGKLLREQILGLVKGEARAAIEGEPACPKGGNPPGGPRGYGEERHDYNEPFVLAKQRMEIVERIMKLGYIKQTRDTEEGEICFVSRDDVISAIYNVAKVSRAKDCGPHPDDNKKIVCGRRGEQADGQ